MTFVLFFVCCLVRARNSIVFLLSPIHLDDDTPWLVILGFYAEFYLVRRYSVP